MTKSFIRPPALSRRHLLQLAGGTTLAAATGVLTQPAHAAVRVDISQGNLQPISIAIPDFVAGAPTETPTAQGVTQIITNNLKRSGLFAPIDPAAFIEKVTNSDAVPRFPDWRQINAQALVTGRITRQGDGRLKAEFRLWDVFSGQQLDGKHYFSRRRTGAASATSSPTRSTSGSPAKAAISTPASSSSTRAGRRSIASSGSPSWTRTAPTCAT